ncbi:MAG: hypothetical protein WA130_09500 [Candidatus Methanoperedens sp.]
MKKEDIKPNIIVRGPIFPEPVQIIVGILMGDSIKLIGKGLSTGQVHEPILNNNSFLSISSFRERRA